MKDEALKLALEALKRMKGYGNTFAYRQAEQNPHEQVCEAITALKQALAQPVQEPVAWVDVKDTHHGPYEFHGKELLPVGKHDLYTTPPAAQRQWVGLTEDEIEECASYGYRYDVVAVTEDKLKEKNNG
jgi:hypothetical protein